MFFEYICKNYYVAQDLTDDRPIFVAHEYMHCGPAKNLPN